MISCIVPTYNEAGNIENMVSALQEVFRRDSLQGEIIVVDDKSPDGTGEIVRKLQKRHKNLRLVVPEVRRGAGAAHKIGYENAKGDILVSMEADLSCDPNDIPKLVKKINDGYDVVVASRYLKGASTNKMLRNILLSKYGNKFLSAISGCRITDFTIAYRAFRREVFESITLRETGGNPFLMEFVVRAHKAGFRVTDIPTEYRERTEGATKNKILPAMIRTFLASLRLAFGI